MDPIDSSSRLLADIGGTNARFAWQAGSGLPLQDVRALPAANYPTVEDAIRDYIAQLGLPMPARAAIAIANPVIGDHVQMTNHHWSFSISALRQALGLQLLEVLNDFTALALALPGLASADKRQVGGGQADPSAAIALLGAGTGLGVSGLVPDGRGGWIPLQGEGGHASLAAATWREWQVVDWLQQRHGHASAERAISGMGLEDVYLALLALDGQATQPGLPAAEITRLAMANQNPHGLEALTLFCAFMGSMAGNLALTVGAKGGVYVGGGIVPRLGEWFDRSPFRERFEAKGRFRSYLAGIPVWVITAAQSPALAGAAKALDQHPA